MPRSTAEVHPRASSRRGRGRRLLDIAILTREHAARPRRVRPATPRAPSYLLAAAAGHHDVTVDHSVMADRCCPIIAQRNQHHIAHRRLSRSGARSCRTCGAATTSSPPRQRLGTAWRRVRRTRPRRL